VAFWYFKRRERASLAVNSNPYALPTSVRFGDNDRINSLSAMQSAVQDPPLPLAVAASSPANLNNNNNNNNNNAIAGSTIGQKPSKRRTMVGQYEMLPQDQQRQQQQQQQWGGSVMQPPSPVRQHSPTAWAGSVAGMPPASPHAHARGNTVVAAQSPLAYDAVDQQQQHEAYDALSLKPTSQPVLSMRERGDTRQQRSAPDLTYQPMTQQPLKYVELGPEKQLRYGGLAPEQPAPQNELWPDEMDSVPNTPMRYDGNHPAYGELGVEPAHPRQYGELGPEQPLRYGELRPEIDGGGEPRAYGEMPIRPSEQLDEQQDAYLQVPEVDGGGELYDQVPTRKMVASPGGRSKNRAMAAAGNNQFR
jgi:hypothetical protein